MILQKITGSIVMLGMLSPFAAPLSNDSVTISLGNQTCQPQAMVAIPLELQNEDLVSFQGMILDIAYDTAKLQYNGLKPGTVINDFENEFSIEETSTGLRVYYSDYSDEGDILSSGSLCWLTFQTNMGRNETTPISIAAKSMSSYENPNVFDFFDFVNGSVTTTGDVLIGDATLDGVVDTADYTLLRRYLLKMIDREEFDAGFTTRMDVTDDGYLDSADYSMMCKYLLGKISVFPAGVYVINNDEEFITVEGTIEFSSTNEYPYSIVQASGDVLSLAGNTEGLDSKVGKSISVTGSILNKTDAVSGNCVLSI
jgi:hypothetical protein